MSLDIERFKASLSEVVAEIEQTDNAEVVAITLSLLRQMAAEIATAAKAVEDRYVTIGPKQAAYAGLPPVEVKRSSKRTEWDHDATLARVVAMARDERRFDPETGVEIEDEFSCAARVISECARLEWRVTPLRARHIDVSELCHEEWGRATVRIG